MEHIKAEILKHVEHAVIHNFKKNWICNDKNGNAAYARRISSRLVLWLIFLILSRSDVYVELISLLKKNIHFFFGLVLFSFVFGLFCFVLFSVFFRFLFSLMKARLYIDGWLSKIQTQQNVSSSSNGQVIYSFMLLTIKRPTLRTAIIRLVHVFIYKETLFLFLFFKGMDSKIKNPNNKGWLNLVEDVDAISKKKI